MTWFRNGTPLEATEVTVPTLRVVRRDTGADMFATSLDPIDSGASYKYDSAILVEPGQVVIAEAGAVVDGVERIWRKILSRNDP